MRELVFMLEEVSAKACLESLLPRFLDPRIAPRMVAFEGKQDLEKQLVKRLRGYLNPNARFIVMRDQDNAPDCKPIKSELLDLCQSAGRRRVSMVRIACRELETFYLADLPGGGDCFWIAWPRAATAQAPVQATRRVGQPQQGVDFADTRRLPEGERLETAW